MGSSASLLKSFVSWASRNGGSAALRAMHDKIVGQLGQSGGKQLVSSTLNGKSFSFAIPSGTDPSELLPVILEAAALLDELLAAGTLADYLSARRATRTKAYFA